MAPRYPACSISAHTRARPDSTRHDRTAIRFPSLPHRSRPRNRNAPAAKLPSRLPGLEGRDRHRPPGDHVESRAAFIAKPSASSTLRSTISSVPARHSATSTWLPRSKPHSIAGSAPPATVTRSVPITEAAPSKGGVARHRRIRPSHVAPSLVDVEFSRCRRFPGEHPPDLRAQRRQEDPIENRHRSPAPHWDRR